MDIFDQEILEFWQNLEQSNVAYIMIGGYATNLHGFQRFTDDLDIWIKDSLDIRKRLREA